MGQIKDGENVVGSRTRVKVVKNKLSPPFQQAEFDIMYDEGISSSGEVLDMGVDYGFIDKSGSWYPYGEERIGQGRENAKQFMRENMEILNAIRSKILEKREYHPGQGLWMIRIRQTRR